jgi:methionyl-tRNA synthetase
VAHPLGKPQILFRKLTDEEVQAEIDELKRRAEGPTPTDEAPYAELGETIVYDDFAKLDLRVGLVTAAEAVPKSKKLIRTEVDLGFETRQILAGVAQHMAPADLVGQRVVVVANLAPRTLFGLESQGMLLMAEDREGRLVLVTTESEPGSVVN